MKRYVREFAADLKRSFTSLANPRIKQNYCEEIDRIVAHYERGNISAPEAVKALVILMGI